MIILFEIMLSLAVLQLPASIAVTETLASFSNASSCSGNPNNLLYVIDRNGQTVSSFSRNGAIEKQIGGRGWGNYEFDGPSDVSLSLFLQVYVTDHSNRRIVQYDKELNYIQTFDENTIQNLRGRLYPLSCVVNINGDMFIVEGDGKRVLKINNRGRIEREFGTYSEKAGGLREPTDIAISPNQDIYVLDKNRIAVYDVFGNYLKSISLAPAQWNNIKVEGGMIIVTSFDRIFVSSLDRTMETTIVRDAVVGLPSGELIMEVIPWGDSLFLLSDRHLYRCNPQ